MPKLPILEPIPVPERALDQALDIQHDTDPAEDHGPARRIPHLGHAVLFFALIVTAVLLFGAFIGSAAHISTEQAEKAHPGLSLLALTLGYITALLAAAWLFPRLWQRSFLQGIQWNALAARRRWFWIMPAAVALSFAAQYSDLHFFPTPPDEALAHLMRTRHGIWFVTLFGILLAPLVEEIAFRGFLLPAFATAYDWLALDRTPAGLHRWQGSSAHTPSALLFAAIFSSIPFALIHADQLSHAWGAVSILYAVSLALSFVRIRTHSVACSVLFHSTYNLTIFAVIFLQTGGYHHLERL